jgi:hypothetical protein
VAEAAAITDPHEKLLANIRVQAHGCRQQGSPFYGALFDRMAGMSNNAARSGVARTVAHEAFVTVRPLRVIGRVHKLVLSGDVPRWRPTSHRSAATVTDAAWPLVVSSVGERSAFFTEALDRPVQTNEVTRSVALVGGLLWLARQAQLPLALRESVQVAGSTCASIATGTNRMGMGGAMPRRVCVSWIASATVCHRSTRRCASSIAGLRSLSYRRDHR